MTIDIYLLAEWVARTMIAVERERECCGQAARRLARRGRARSQSHSRSSTLPNPVTSLPTRGSHKAKLTEQATNRIKYTSTYYLFFVSLSPIVLGCHRFHGGSGEIYSRPNFGIPRSPRQSNLIEVPYRCNHVVYYWSSDPTAPH